MFKFFKKIHNHHSEVSYLKIEFQDGSEIILNPSRDNTNSYGYKFDYKSITSKRRFSICFHKNHKDIKLSNAQVQIENNYYYITGVNTFDFARKNGLTDILFSWIILRLMEEKNGDEFDIYCALGSYIIQILNSNNKFIYYKIFDNSNPYVKLNFKNYPKEAYAIRKFKKNNRDVDKKYFENLLFTSIKRVLNNEDKILSNQ